MSRPTPTIAIQAAAYLFTKHPEATDTELANMLAVSQRSLYRWTKRPQWHAALDDLNYTGSRTLRKAKARDAQRENPLYTAAKKCYLEARAAGESPAKAARAAETETGIPRRRIKDWAKRYDWDAGSDRNGV